MKVDGRVIVRVEKPGMQALGTKSGENPAIGERSGQGTSQSMEKLYWKNVPFGLGKGLENPLPGQDRAYPRSGSSS